MGRKETKRGNSTPQTWRQRWSWALGGVAIVAICLSIRYFSTTQLASAQAPVRGYTPPGSATPLTPVPQPGPPPVASPNQAAVPVSAASTKVQGRRSLPEKTMAIVNGEELTRDDLARESTRRFGEDVLQALVNKWLILQACNAHDVMITQQDIDEEITNISKKFGLSPDRWLELLAKERQIDADQYRRDIVWPTLALRRLAADKLQITQEEFDKAWESHYGPRVQVRMISTTSREQADKLHAAAVANPQNFDDLAKDYSEDANSAAARGLIPPIRRNVGEKAVEDAAFALEKGGISPVIHVANQYLILKCEAHLAGTYIDPKSEQDATRRLIDQLRDQKLRTAAGDIFKRLQEEAKVTNVYNNPQLRQQMPGVAATINGQQITYKQLADECMLRHGLEVLEGEINRTLLVQELKRHGASVSEQDIDAEINRAARLFGFTKRDGTPDIETWLSRVTEEGGTTIELYVRDTVWPSVALKKLVAAKVEITKEDLQRAYDANYGERVEVLALVVDNQRRAHEVWDMARTTPTDKFFGELAAQYSIEPLSKANSGHVPPIRRYSGQPSVEEEAFRLQKGELSGVIAVGDKFIILRCLGRVKTDAPEFAEVSDELKLDIHEKKLRLAMAKEFDRLKETAQVDNFLAGTSQAGGHRPAGAPPAAVRPVSAESALPVQFGRRPVGTGASR